MVLRERKVKMTEEARDKLYTNRDLMNILGVSRITLWRYRTSGLLSHIRLEKEVRYTRQHLSDFLAARERGSDAPQVERKGN